MGYYSGGDYYMAGGWWDDLKGAASGYLSRAFTPAPGRVLPPALDPIGTLTGKIAPPLARGLGMTVQGGPGPAGFQLPDFAGGGGGLGMLIDGKRKRRRMNVLNPRALRRGMRRVQGFAKFARKTISFTQRVKMKKRRK